MGISKFFDLKFLKYLLVGILNTVVGACVMFLLYNKAHFSYWISSSCNYLIGGIMSYFLNKYYTFEDSRKSVKIIVLFIVNLICCYLIAYVGAKYLIYFICRVYSKKCKDNIAMICGICLYTGINYISQRFFIFNYKSCTENKEK